jgi:lysophospholipase L1-like esterase
MRRKAICIFLSLLLVMPSMVAQTAVAHPWKGKKVAYFGDSITDPRNNGSKKKYWGFLQDWLEITPYVYAVSGRQWNDIPRQADKLKAEHGDSVDAILILMGTNDFNHGIPIGQWYEEKTEKVYAAMNNQTKTLQDRKCRTLVMDNNTYKGRINIALSKLKQMYPTKQIVLLTPLHRAGFYPNEKNWQPTENYANVIGVYLDEYVNAVKEAGNIWAVPVIDLNSVSGLYPMTDEQAQYFHLADTDRLHPNDAGHQRMARTLMYQLQALPCVF